MESIIITEVVVVPLLDEKSGFVIKTQYEYKNVPSEISSQQTSHESIHT